MKFISMLVCKLYYNGNYGIESPSTAKFYMIQISVSFIILFWFHVLIEFLKTVLDIGLKESFTAFYILLFCIIFYFLNKNTWTLDQVEEYINDKENEETLNDMIWVFWASLIVPTIMLMLI
jgi:hypothetical protein